MITTDNSPAAIASRFVNSTGRHVFLTGKAGTGKTTFLRNIKAKTHKSALIAAPTGIAAINAEGVTLHSLFQLPFGTFIPANVPFNQDSTSVQLNTPHTLVRGMKINKDKQAMLREFELLIIDEVSMLRADLLDAIDHVLKYVRRKRDVPFGGVQILFIGDLHQLPPVVKEDEKKYLDPWYDSPYFFEAHALRDNEPIYIELDKIFRQSDKKFISILNNLRDNKITEEDLKVLNHHYKPGYSPAKKDPGTVYLTTHNYKANDINKNALKKLPGDMYIFEAVVEDDFDEYLYPVDYELKLKMGAQVMFIKNDYSGEHRYFNGKIGIVSDLSSDKIVVKFNDGTPSTEVEKYTWENKRYTLDKEKNEITEHIKGTFTHYPIKLAWAITVHKSQGLTFEKAVIDVAGAFAPGQIYVALSRLVSLEGLVLTAQLPKKMFSQEEAILEFAKTQKDKEILEKEYEEESHIYVRDHVMRAFNFNILWNLYFQHVQTYTLDEKKSAKQQYRKWAVNLQSELKQVKEVADKFLLQLQKITQRKANGSIIMLQKRVKAANEYFEPLLKEFSQKIYSHINALKGQKGVKKYVKELRDVERLFFSQLMIIRKSEALIQAVVEKTELSKEAMNDSKLHQERSEIINQNDTNVVDTKKQKKENKKNQPNTKEISFNMYKSGKTIEEIAGERSLAITTIEGHLAHYVGKGELDLDEFVEESKIEPIIKASEELETTRLSPIKGILGDEFTYSDLKFVMAKYVRMQKEENNAEQR